MVNERLDFNDEKYKLLDIIDHLARYSVIKELCENKNVLDAACGEGYGSFLMAEFWNANSVTAIDISPTAIKSAKDNFLSSKINYLCHDLEHIEDVLPSGNFDIIISLETIEHLKNPNIFLSRIKKLLKPSGLIVISCPNDNWWYQNKEDSNPYHIHKYNLHDFKDLCQQYLGKPSQIMLGTSVIGIGNINLEAEISNTLLAKDIVSNLEGVKSQKLPIQNGVNLNNCSYFLCVWGGDQARIEQNFIVYPSLLELYRQYGYYLNNNSLDKYLLHLEDRVKNLDSELQEIKSSNFWKLHSLITKIKKLFN